MLEGVQKGATMMIMGNEELIYEEGLKEWNMYTADELNGT